MATPFLIHHLGAVGSTQERARAMAESGEPVPLLVTAERQTRGRGRTGHTWRSAPRALACSLAVAPGGAADRLPLIPLITGLAARRALREVCGVTAGLKWPNDLVVDEGKVGGILVEGFGNLVVIGVGINLWWPAPPDGFASALADDPGPELGKDLAVVLAGLLIDELDGDLTQWGRAAYEAASVTLGRDVTWAPEGRGHAVAIAPDGGLVVDTDAGRQTLRSGEVHTVRPATLLADPEREVQDS